MKDYTIVRCRDNDSHIYASFPAESDKAAVESFKNRIGSELGFYLLCKDIAEAAVREAPASPNIVKVETL